MTKDKPKEVIKSIFNLLIIRIIKKKIKIILKINNFHFLGKKVL